MSRRLLLAWVLLTPLAWPASGQTLLPGNTLPTRVALQRLGLDRAWYTSVPLGGGTEQLIEISVAGDTLFAQTNVGMLYAYEAETGRLIWSTSLGRPSGEAQPVSLNSTMVFASNGQHLVAMERASGRVLWDYYLQATASSATAANDQLVIVGLHTGKLVAYRLEPLEKQFRRENGPPGGFAFAWQTSGPITAPPIIANQVVAFSSRGGQVYVAQLEPPLLVHRSQRHGAFSAQFGRYGTRTLLAPSLDNNVYGFDLFTGEVLWIYSTGAPVDQEPLVAGDDAYIVNTRGDLSALDPKTGQPRWDEASRPTGAVTLLSVSPKRIYMQSPYGELIIVDRVAGNLLADARATSQRAGLNLRDYLLSPTNTLNDRIYLATPSGFLVCLHELGADQPIPVRDPKALGFGQIPPAAPAPGTFPPPAGEAGGENPL